MIVVISLLLAACTTTSAPPPFAAATAPKHIASERSRAARCAGKGEGGFAILPVESEMNGEAKNGRLTYGHVVAAVVPVIAVIAPAVGFYLHDRDVVGDKIKELHSRISENSARISSDARAFQDLVVDFRGFMGEVKVWEQKEEEYDREVRNRFQSGDEKVNAMVVKLHERIDAMQLMLAQKPAPDYMFLPRGQKYPK